MSVESTRLLTRQQAEEMLAHAIAQQLMRLRLMTDSEMEAALYANTRESHYFENFRIVPPEEV